LSEICRFFQASLTARERYGHIADLAAWSVPAFVRRAGNRTTYLYQAGGPTTATEAIGQVAAMELIFNRNLAAVGVGDGEASVGGVVGVADALARRLGDDADAALGVVGGAGAAGGVGQQDAPAGGVVGEGGAQAGGQQFGGASAGGVVGGRQAQDAGVEDQDALRVCADPFAAGRS
jgi:hypothetical protein